VGRLIVATSLRGQKAFFSNLLERKGNDGLICAPTAAGGPCELILVTSASQASPSNDVTR